MSIAKSITELRTASGMSQQSLADALYVSRDLVSKWERGLRRPDYRMIEKISEVSRKGQNMNEEKIYNVISGIDEDLTDRSLSRKTQTKAEKRRTFRWLYAAAAALAVCVIAALPILSPLHGKIAVIIFAMLATM